MYQYKTVDEGGGLENPPDDHRFILQLYFYKRI